MSNRPRIFRADFSEGARWLTGGADLLARGGWTMVRVAAWLVVISLIQIVPLIGLLALVVISPALTAGLMALFRTIDEGRAPAVNLLFAGFSAGPARGRLLVLGSWLLIGVILAFSTMMLWLSSQMDLQVLAQLLNDSEATERNSERLFAMFEGVNVFGGIVVSGLIFAVVVGALFFAVPLVFFWDWPVLAALLWSLRAMLVNWVAMLGFGLLAAGLLLAAGFVFGLMANLLMLAFGAVGGFAVQVLSMVFSLFLQLLFAAAQWRAFRCVFMRRGDGDGNIGRDKRQDSDVVEV